MSDSEFHAMLWFVLVASSLMLTLLVVMSVIR